ncbi:MAG: dihydroxyacetone kinase subunit L [Eubacterium sp.]|nr:dihydroxyacetone kinase subunit L [Eubacterium sp.]
MADKAKVLEILDKVILDMDDQKLFLTELDNVIGDGDHGINMDRGFQAVKKQMPTYDDLEVDGILKDVGKQLMKVVGGSAGPLYGSAFRKAGVYLKGKTEVSMDDFIGMMETSIEQIQKLGHAVEGEKTMLDAMIPATKAMKESYAADGDYKKALEAGVAAAEAGVEYTKTIIATKGRASYLGERSIGHQDPGATSFTLMLKDVAELA